jgi:hypothetical protein
MGLQKLAGVYLNLFTKNTITRRHEFWLYVWIILIHIFYRWHWSVVGLGGV